MEALDGALVYEDEEDSQSLALPNSVELSPDVISAHIQDIVMGDKDSRGDTDSSKDKDYDYISDQENSDSFGTTEIDFTVDNKDFFR